MPTAGPRYRPAYFLYRLFWQSLDWLFPPTCGGCGQSGLRWCESCIQQVHRMETSICQVCGETLQATGICKDCLTTIPAFAQVRSWGYFEGPLREALHRLKYGRDPAMGEALAVHLIQRLEELAWPVNVVIPVPLSKVRLADRGYNQAALLARPLALAGQFAFRPDALIRVKDTRSQVGLTVHERKENVAGAFQADRKVVHGQTVLVVDDVATTAATINACAQALRLGGAARVYGLTLARANKHTDSVDSPAFA